MSIEQKTIDMARNLKQMGESFLDLATRVMEEMTKEKEPSEKEEKTTMAFLDDLEKFEFNGIRYRKESKQDRILLSDDEEPDVCFGAIIQMMAYNSMQDEDHRDCAVRLFKSTTAVTRISKK